MSGTTQMGKSPAIPPPMLEKADVLLAWILLYQDERVHPREAGFHDLNTGDVAVEQLATKIFPSVESSQPGVKIGMFFSQAATTHAILRIDFDRSVDRAAAISWYMHSYGK